jgi:hypothetical protein
MTARGRRGGRGIGFGAHRGILKRGEGVVGEGARWRGGPQHAIYVLSVEEDDNDQREEERRGMGQKVVGLAREEKGLPCWAREGRSGQGKKKGPRKRGC